VFNGERVHALNSQARIHLVVVFHYVIPDISFESKHGGKGNNTNKVLVLGGKCFQSQWRRKGGRDA